MPTSAAFSSNNSQFLASFQPSTSAFQHPLPRDLEPTPIGNIQTNNNILATRTEQQKSIEGIAEEQMVSFEALIKYFGSLNDSGMP
jgi:hypothetical protein